MIFEESDDILEDKDNIKEISIKYQIKSINKTLFESRSTKEKKYYLNKYFNNIDKIKDKYLLKYIYFDIYNTEEDNIDKIYNDLLELTQKDFNKIYNSIKQINI